MPALGYGAYLVVDKKLAEPDTLNLLWFLQKVSQMGLNLV